MLTLSLSMILTMHGPIGSLLPIKKSDQTVVLTLKAFWGGPFPIKSVSFAELTHIKGGFKHNKILATAWTHRRICEIVARLRSLYDPTGAGSRGFLFHTRQWTRLQAKLNLFYDQGSMPWAVSILQDINSTWVDPKVEHIALFEAWAAILKQAIHL